MKSLQNDYHLMRAVTLGLFLLGLVAGLLHYDGLSVFFGIVISGDIISYAISRMLVIPREGGRSENN